MDKRLTVSTIPGAPSSADKPKSNGDIRAWRAKNNWQKWAAMLGVATVLCTGVWFILTGNFQTSAAAAEHERDEAVENAKIKSRQDQMLHHLQDQTTAIKDINDTLLLIRIKMKI